MPGTYSTPSTQPTYRLPVGLSRTLLGGAAMLTGRMASVVPNRLVLYGLVQRTQSRRSFSSLSTMLVKANCYASDL